jgi:hypothetical protein
MLVSLAKQQPPLPPEPIATWIQLLTGVGGAIRFQTGDGLTAVPDVTGTLFMPNGILTTTATTPNVNSITVSVVNGGDGQIIIGQGAADPVWGNLTSQAGTIVITPNLTGPGTINLETIGAPGATTYIEDVGNATPAADILNIIGAGGITTSGAGNTVTITQTAPGAATTYTTDAGNAIPIANILNILGDGVNITTAGAGNTVTISLAAPLVPFASAFYYYANTARYPVTGNGAIDTTVFGHMVFDLNGDFDGISTFTAPRTGIYFFRTNLAISRGVAQTTNLQTFIVTPAVTYTSNVINFTNLWVAGTNGQIQQEAITHLNAGDHVQVRWSSSGGGLNVGSGTGNSGYDTNFSGFLIS